MSFPDIVPELKARMPELRGRLLANQPLGEFTWFRVGGAAQAFFMPQDENDLAYFLRNLPADIPVTVIGAGSNLIVRDGGVPGVVIRLGRGFNEVKIEDDHRVTAGAAILDALVARAARDAGIAGLALLLRHSGRDRRRAAHERRRLWRRDQGRAGRGARAGPAGNARTFSNAEMGFAYRHCGAPEDVIFTAAVFQGRAGDVGEINAEMDAIKNKREASQPRNRTGGSTFKNPPGHKSWELIDAAGCRGLTVGGAQVSPLHCNFLINLGHASARDIETLGETVRARVKAQCRHRCWNGKLRESE